MSETRHSRLIIIGSGAAGYTAAIYAARAMLEPVLIAGLQPGGQLTITTEVENYPGFADVIQGPWLMEQMREQAEKVGTEMISDIIVEADLKTRPFVLKGDSGTTYTADSVIIATGAQAKWLGLESEQKFQGFGVSACATCDGFFYRGKEVVVVGGGNTAVEEALFLTNFASKVTLVHRRDSLRAEKVMQERLFKNEKVEIVWDSAVEEVLGEMDPPGVTGVRVKNLKPARPAKSRPMASSSPSATPRPPNSSSTSCRPRMAVIWKWKPGRRRRQSPVYSPPETLQMMSTVRL